MAKFNMNDMDNYGSNGANNYFSLKDDKDTARIRFLYRDTNDIQGVATHEVEVNGKKMDVECLRAYNEPIDNCPLCAAGYKVNAKLYIPVYDEEAQQAKIWTRGKTFFSKLSSLCSRYKPLVSTVFEVERNGKKGDTNTTYELYNIATDNTNLEDIESINAEGIAYQSKSFEELQFFLNNGIFPDEVPQTRATNNQPGNQQNYQRPNTREMPASTMRRRPTSYDPGNTF